MSNPRDKCFYAVVHVGDNGRMAACKHGHLTSDDARICAGKLKGISIIEWVKDRTPQFKEVWRSPEMSPS